MMNFIYVVWLIFNGLLLLFVCHELFLLIHALIRNKATQVKVLPTNLPKVTIQLPLYNEKYVVERLLTSAANVNYPSDLLEIQVLDDSSDETSKIISDFISTHKNGHLFTHIQRTDRTGFKAGALAYGLNFAQGDFVAVFDADFVIDPNFVRAVIPWFEDEKVGVVQTKWTHLNENFSMLTRAQALMLDTHFSIEQLGRSEANSFINFNGTAGIWRKSCIIDAGGWQADTLTEDLDLSYRAQIRGWKFEYLFGIGAPSELPVTFEAYKTQQYRWSKGAAECVRKNWQLLWHSKIGVKEKILGTFHLLNSSVYLLIIPIIILSPIVYYGMSNYIITVDGLLKFRHLGIVTTSALILIFFIGNLIGQKNPISKIIWFVPSIFFFFAMTSGISLYMLIGVLEGYFKKASEFVRTPKFGDDQTVKSKIKGGYDFKKEINLKIFELIFLVYGIGVIVASFIEMNLPMGIYGAILTLGFSLAVFLNKKTFA
jgi:cellulose synthase/poly-beta-1,6-N-acetylglucosamine synthase-like glycosyltransferase